MISHFFLWCDPFKLIGDGERMLHRKCNLNEQLLNCCCSLVIIIHLKKCLNFEMFFALVLQDFCSIIELLVDCMMNS